ncbi:MAG: hypothetical protein JWR00_4441 [Rubritepida sp.]|nr:hypothetical protein [Rubritepida sp.]
MPARSGSSLGSLDLRVVYRSKGCTGRLFAGYLSMNLAHLDFFKVSLIWNSSPHKCINVIQNYTGNIQLHSENHANRFRVSRHGKNFTSAERIVIPLEIAAEKCWHGGPSPAPFRRKIVYRFFRAGVATVFGWPLMPASARPRCTPSTRSSNDTRLLSGPRAVTVSQQGSARISTHPAHLHVFGEPAPSASRLRPSVPRMVSAVRRWRRRPG